MEMRRPASRAINGSILDEERAVLAARALLSAVGRAEGWD
jgi:hypothetical protein